MIGSSDDDTYEAPAILAEDAILFPDMEVTMTIRDSKNIAAAEQALKEHNLVVLIPAPGPEGPVGSIGTLVFLRNLLPGRGAGAQWLSRGLWRVRVDRVVEDRSYIRVRFRRAEAGESTPKSELMKSVHAQIDEFARLIPGVPSEIIVFLKTIETPGKLADMCAYSPFFTLDERRDLLKTLDAEERLGKIHELFKKQLSELKQIPKNKTIVDCTTCIELADRAFEAGPNRGAEVAREFLDHVVREHPEEVLGLLAERYGPAFMRRRELK